MVDRTQRHEVPRPVIVVAIALATVLAVGVATVGVIAGISERSQHQAAREAVQARRSGPLAMPPIPAPQAESPGCAAVLAALPAELTMNGARVPRRPIAPPVPPATVAWGDAGHDPVSVRCGLDSPAELTPTSKLTEVSGVSWLRISEFDRTSWLAVDRPVRVALTVSDSAGTGPLQELSAVIRATLPRQDVFPG